MAVEVVGVIPARLASTRLPRKVLLNRTGKWLIQHVWEAAQRATSLSRLVIATDSEEVLNVCRGFGAECLMTRAEHPNGTSRLAEAADLLKLADDSIVVNVQGDEPELDSGIIDAGVECLKLANPERCPVATVASPFADRHEVVKAATVKVVLRPNGTALYFSRAAIPQQRVGGTREQCPLRHVGLYVYRRWFLRTYLTLPPTPLERTEMLEQLRILEHGYDIAVTVRACHHSGIDTESQYEAFVRRVLAAKR